MPDINRIFKAGGIVFVGVIFSKIFGYLFRVVVARKDLELYGTYNLAFSIVGFLLPFMMLGLDEGVIRYVSYYKGKGSKEKEDAVVSTALKFVLPMSILFALVLFFFSEKISAFFGAPGLGFFLRFFAFLFPFMALFSIFSSVLKANKKIGAVVFSESFFNNFLRLIIIISFFYFGFVELGVASAFLISSLLSMVFVFFYARKFFRFSLKGFDSELFRFSLPLMFVFLIGSLLVRTDTLMLGYFTDVIEVGLYNAAWPTAQLLLIFSLAFLTIFLPVITTKYVRGESIGSDYSNVTRYIFTFTLPFALLMILFSKEIVLVLFGGEYLSSWIPLSILSFSYIFWVFGHTSEKVLIMLKRTKLMFVLLLGVFILNIVLNILLVPFFSVNYGHGMYGAAISTALSLVLLSFFHVVYAGIYSRSRILDYIYLKILVMGVVSGALVYLLKGLFDSIFYYLILSMLFLSLYFFVAWRMGILRLGKPY